MICNKYRLCRGAKIRSVINGHASGWPVTETRRRDERRPNRDGMAVDPSCKQWGGTAKEELTGPADVHTRDRRKNSIEHTELRPVMLSHYVTRTTSTATMATPRITDGKRRDKDHRSDARNTPKPKSRTALTGYRWLRWHVMSYERPDNMVQSKPYWR